MNSFFGTTAAKRPRPHFRHYLALEPAAHQQSTSKFVERVDINPNLLGLAEATR